MKRPSTLKDKRALAVAIVIGFILLSTLGVKAKQAFDRIEYLESVVDDQSGEIEQLKTSIEEHENTIDELESEVEDLKYER